MKVTREDVNFDDILRQYRSAQGIINLDCIAVY